MSAFTRMNGHGQEATIASSTQTITEDAVTAGHSFRLSKSPGIRVPMTASRSDCSDLEGSLSGHIHTLVPQVQDTIQPKRDHCTLVLCFDGTGDKFDTDNSNIVNFFSLLEKDHPTKQKVYYQPGLGTYTSPGIMNPVMARISEILDEMVAWNLDSHVMSGYEFLMQNYTAGDRICIFGFSRGAYTARALAGMIHKVGLLPACNFRQVPFAYKMYICEDENEISAGFKKAFSRDVSIEFIGVWDTVESVGFIPKHLPFTTSNTTIRTFRHALSLDEHRAKFKANLWHRPDKAKAKQGWLLPLLKDIFSSPKSTGHLGLESKSEERSDDMSSEKNTIPTDVEEVWFSGCHCDVGGGSVLNKTKNSLARIPLRWMIRECYKANTCIMFKAEELKKIGLDPLSLSPHVIKRPRPPALSRRLTVVNNPPSFSFRLFFRQLIFSETGKSYIYPENGGSHPVSEEEEDLKDATCPMYDQLSLNWFWWILEVIPMKLWYLNKNDTWVSRFWPNLGRPRIIPTRKLEGIRFHRTVKTRMEALSFYGGNLGKKYKPRAQPNGEPIWVEPTWVD